MDEEEEQVKTSLAHAFGYVWYVATWLHRDHSGFMSPQKLRKWRLIEFWVWCKSLLPQKLLINQYCQKIVDQVQCVPNVYNLKEITLDQRFHHMSTIPANSQPSNLV